MARRRPRNYREQLQTQVGTRATILERRVQTDQTHRQVGWYAAVHYLEPDCGCAWCSSASDERDHYIGYHIRDAIIEIADYQRTHADDAF